MYQDLPHTTRHADDRCTSIKVIPSRKSGSLDFWAVQRFAVSRAAFARLGYLPGPVAVWQLWGWIARRG